MPSAAMQPPTAEPVLDPARLTPFLDPLQTPPVARPLTTRAASGGSSGPVPLFRYPIKEFRKSVHRQLAPTVMWGYNGWSPGPTFEAKRGQPFFVEWRNELPSQHLLPIDHSLHGAEESKPTVRTVVHLHGGRTPPQFDGYPEAWFTPGSSFTYFYPNQQEAAALFYHDHAMGITRLNTLAGLVGLYIVRDDTEAQLGLPNGRYEVPLILYDRTFTTAGQLHYPVSPDPACPWVSEFIGNAILVNGSLFPYLEVEPCAYRFRVLNTSNGGFYYLSLAKERAAGREAEVFWQIGSDQGLLSRPFHTDHVFLAPGERADLIVDFRSFAGQNLLVKAQSASALQFRVAAGKVRDELTLPAVLRPIERLPESSAIHSRELFLADNQDRLGGSHQMLLNGQHWDMPVTERPLLDSTEIWSFINLTDDTHPIHLHLVRFQVLDRRPFDLQVYHLTRQLVFTGPLLPPDVNEAGWKDTVRVPATLVTRIIVKFEGYPGRYVWHCHVLEHEDNEMMRPYDVVRAE